MGKMSLASALNYSIKAHARREATFCTRRCSAAREKKFRFSVLTAQGGRSAKKEKRPSFIPLAAFFCSSRSASLTVHQIVITYMNIARRSEKKIRRSSFRDCGRATFQQPTQPLHSNHLNAA